MTDTYRSALESVSAELEEILEERGRLRKRLEEIEARTDILKATVGSLSSLLGEDVENADGSKGLTDAIKEIIRSKPEAGFTTGGLRQRLREANFPIDAYSQPMAVLNTTLRRLAGQQILIQGEFKDSKKTYFQWNPKQPITDDDIPF